MILSVKLVLWSVGIVILIHFLKAVKKFGSWMFYLRKIPSPANEQFFYGHITLVQTSPETIFARLREWAREFYPLYKLKFAFVHVPLLLCPEDYELVMSNPKHIQKSMLYDLLIRWLRTGLLTSDGEKWQLRRKILTPAFHFGILQEFLQVFNEETASLVETLRKECDKPFSDVVPIISHSTLKIIAETAMGYKMNFESSAARKYKNGVYNIIEVYLYKLFTAWMFFDPIFRLTPTGIKEGRIIKDLHHYTTKVIAKRELYYEETKKNPLPQERKKRMAMLDLLLSIKDKEAVIDSLGIREEVDTFMFEGHDTTAVGLSFMLMLLANHKEAQDQIVLEMEEVMDDIHKNPTYDDLQNLKYMERVIKECMRLYPSVPLISRYLGEDMVTSSGYFIPKGAIVGMHIYDTHHSPHVFPDPEKFDPDRFLPENCVNRHPFAYVPFSAGPRNCIGQRFAMMEIKTVLCGVLSNFELEPIDTPDTLTLVVDLVLRTKGGQVKVKFLPRSAEKQRTTSSK